MTSAATFVYSAPVPRNVYDDERFFCQFEPRTNQNAAAADRGSCRAQLDWVSAGGSDEIIGNVNVQGGNFASLYVPECLPDRMELVSYMFEYAFLHDDFSDLAHNRDGVQRENIAVWGRIYKKFETADLSDERVSVFRKKQIQTQMLEQLLEMDKDLGELVFSDFKSWVAAATKIRDDPEFDNLDDYFDARILDIGASFTFSLLRWGSSIKLSVDALCSLRAIERVVSIALILANDYFSWEREYRLCGTTNIPIINAIVVLMKRKNVDAVAAKSIVKGEIIQYESLYRRLRDDILLEFDPESPVRRYLSTLDLAIAGNFLWHMTTPRYNNQYPNPYRFLHAEAVTWPLAKEQ